MRGGAASTLTHSALHGQCRQQTADSQATEQAPYFSVGDGEPHCHSTAAQDTGELVEQAGGCSVAAVVRYSLQLADVCTFTSLPHDSLSTTL